MACGKIRAKQELVRLVRVAGGKIEVDASGKKAGRGAYLCRAQQCWAVGLRGGRLEHSLRTKLARENIEHLIKFREDFLKEQVSG